MESCVERNIDFVCYLMIIGIIARRVVVPESRKGSEG